MSSVPSTITPITCSQLEHETAITISGRANIDEESLQPNIWEEICKEYAKNYRGIKDTLAGDSFETRPDLRSTGPDLRSTGENLDVLLVTLNGINHAQPCTDSRAEFMKTCTPKEYLETVIFPTLLPALEAMLRHAKLEKCFERKRTKFNALDFLTEYLYIENPNKPNRKHKDLWQIPFVDEWLKAHPRPPLPLSLIWTESEATTVIQSHWRGYKVRCEPEVEKLRIWQREWRQINGSIGQTVEQFWARKMNRVSMKRDSPHSKIPNTA